MAHTRKIRNRKPLQAVILVVLVLAILVGMGFVLRTKGRSTMNASAIQEGLEFLTQLEQKSPESVRQARQALYVRRMEAQKDELVAQLENGEVDPFSLFQDYAVMGDSRSVGFWYRNFLEQDRVLADGGNIIRNIPGWYEQLEEMNPSYIFLCYGLNDCSIGIWTTGEEYAEEYMTYARKLRELLPDCTIVISSILPAQDPAFEKSTRWRRIPEWNEQLEKYCKEEGFLFADCNWIYEEHPNLWDIDGIHFKEPLYPYWGSELIITALYGGITNET